MKINRTHKIRIYPNNLQSSYLIKCFGLRRLAYNWGINEWKRQYKDIGRASEYSVKNAFNKIKREKFPFAYDVTKSATESGFKSLGRAYSAFFRRVKSGKSPGYPKYKRKGRNDWFQVDNISVKVTGKKIKLPKTTPIKMSQEWRFCGDKLMNASIIRKNGKWFAVISSEAEIEPPKTREGSIGVDVGIKHIAVTSNGDFFKNGKFSRGRSAKIKMLQKSVSRKKKGSKNREKAKGRLRKEYDRISNMRLDQHHKASDAITKQAGLVGIESLGLSGMCKNKRISKSLYDSGMGNLLDMIRYKSLWRGAKVVQADRFFPSSKKCSSCGNVKRAIDLGMRTYDCDKCHVSLDRDLNAAINLEKYAVGFTD